MMEDKVSVIVPVYNVEKYLRRCVDSIIKQTYRNLEIILVDDGSPDNCGEICDEYARQDPRVRVIHQENRGLSAARNAGLDAATGEYISFVDSDDWIEASYLEKLILEATCDSIVVSNLVYWFSDTQNKVAMFPRNTETIEENAFWRRTMSSECTPYIVSCCKLYPACFFRSVRFCEGMYHEDEEILHKLAEQAQCMVIRYDAVYFYRQNPDGIMGKGFSAKTLDAYVAWADRLAYFRSRNLSEAENLLAAKYWERYKNHIFTKEALENQEGHRAKAIKKFKTAFPSLVRVRSIPYSQKISVVAMRIHPNCFRTMWNILNRIMFILKRRHY